jgi:hypothetical protein
MTNSQRKTSRIEVSPSTSLPKALFEDLPTRARKNELPNVIGRMARRHRKSIIGEIARRERRATVPRYRRIGLMRRRFMAP